VPGCVRFQTPQAVELPPSQPLAVVLRGSAEGSGRWLDPMCPGVPDQLQPEMDRIFTLSRERVVWEWTHRSSALLFGVETVRMSERVDGSNSFLLGVTPWLAAYATPFLLTIVMGCRGVRCLVRFPKLTSLLS
jgi:hypothetical protein